MFRFGNFSPEVAGSGNGLLLCLFVLSVSQAVHAQDEIEKLFWESVECGDEAQVRAYLETYPGGHYTDAAVDCLKADEAENAEERIAELLAACAVHVKANRLTTGAAGNALDCYRQVLDQDPDNAEAMDGLQNIETTYARWARSAIETGDAGRARANFEKLRTLNPEHPALGGIEGGIGTLEERARAEARRDEETERDREFWRGVSCDSKSELESYKKSFPDGQYVRQANDCLATIEQQSRDLALLQEKARDRKFWESISCENESQLVSYKQNFPEGMYVQEANRCLRTIKQAKLRANSVYGFWSGTGSDFLVPTYQVSLDIRENDLTIHADYPGGTSCEGKLVADGSVGRLAVGQNMSFEAQLTSGPCFKKAKVKIEWTGRNRLEYSWYKLGIKMGGGELARR